MAVATFRVTLDMQIVCDVRVMHRGEPQTVNPEIMMMRMQRGAYLVDHQQQHQEQPPQPCECTYGSVRWRSAHPSRA